MKPIRLSAHALSYCTRRGFTAAEVEETIRTCPWEKVELGRLEARKELPFNAQWNGRTYAVRQVRPVFVDEPNEIVVITVYTYYY
ncbi:MAG: hypothetical protein A2Y76_02035 [Planctomycetes bacterium RBG_13_60_9]|nr:MAG: hypothetical protein A2Y76_02035 [Planctomycetes bacterium RBG_13_60_9]